MGPLGWPETVFIFLLALILFGPKKLPELGRTVGKALTEFRRASSELKATFDREMKSLEQETESIREAANQYQSETYSYDYSHHDSSYEGAYGYDGSYGHENHDSSVTSPSNTVSASAPQDAESHAAAPEGTVAHGSQLALTEGKVAHDPHREPDPNGSPAPAAPHNA
jgi:sec-independent protein translocase protein TatA